MPKDKQIIITYKVGSSFDEIQQESTISANNPFLKPLGAALKKLEPKKGHWGVSLEQEDFESNLKRKKISKLEYDLLCLLAYDEYEEEDVVENFCKKHKFEFIEGDTEDFIGEFYGLFRTDTEYSFLTYQSHKIKTL